MVVMMVTGGFCLNEDSALSCHPCRYPKARRMKRRIICHCGPTNSGKTHEVGEKTLSRTIMQEQAGETLSRTAVQEEAGWQRTWTS